MIPHDSSFLNEESSYTRVSLCWYSPGLTKLDWLDTGHWANLIQILKTFQKWALRLVDIVSLGMVHIIEYLYNLLCFSLFINNMGQGKTLMYVGIQLETFSRRIFVLPFSDSISDLFLLCRKLQVFLLLFALIVPFKSMTFLVPILIVLFIAAFTVRPSYKFCFSPFIQTVVSLAAGRLISLGLISRPLLSSSHSHLSRNLTLFQCIHFSQLPMYIFDSHPSQKYPIFNPRETSTHLKKIT